MAGRPPPPPAFPPTSLDAGGTSLLADPDSSSFSLSPPPLGPAETAARSALGWPALCTLVARFASTSAGRAVALDLPLGSTESESARLAAETGAAAFVEGEMGRELEFGGVSTASAASALSRAARGGLLSGADLAAVASLAGGAARLAGAVRAAARAAAGMETGGSEGSNPVAPLARPFEGFDGSALRGLIREVADAIDEGGAVRDNASEALRSARLAVRSAAERARGAVKSAAGAGPGEVAERGGRFCLALPDGSAPPRGAVLLGSGGGLAFYEPPGAVGPNNAAAAAQGAAAAAEEAVRWRLTGSVSDAAPVLSRAYSLVVWADVTAARARYGAWVGGVLAEFVPVGGGAGQREAAWSGRGGRGARVAAARAKRRAEGETPAATAAAAPSPSDTADDDPAWHVQLFQYRHPLLLGAHLTAAEAAARRARAGGAGTSAAAAAAGAALRSLSTRRKGGKKNDAPAKEAKAASSVPPPPVPIDVAIRPGVRVVTITGPNTGGKTAALKAVGLAALAAKAGLPLPARQPARLPWFSAVLADIGDGQSLGAGLSTFGGHLARVSALRREAGPAALVLLDELGTGTDPAEGAALGAALLAALAAGGPRGAGLTLATTHAAALAELKAARPASFENAAAEFDAVNLAPTHRLLWGLPGRSCGLDVAERLGLDGAVVADARARLHRGTESASTTTTTGGGAAEALDAARRAAEADTDAAAAARAAAEAARSQAAALAAGLATAGAAADLEVAAAVGRAADAAAAELRKRAARARKAGGGGGERPVAAGAAGAPSITTPRGATRLMGALARGSGKKAGGGAQQRTGRGGPPPGWTPAVGDRVSIPRLKARGTVLAVSGRQVTVAVGGLVGRASVSAGEVEWDG